jgi:hypothetical protein
MKEIKIKHPIFSAFYHGPGEQEYFDAEGNLNTEGLDLLVKGPTQHVPKFMDGDQIELKVNYEEDGVEHVFSWFLRPMQACALLFDKKACLYTAVHRRFLLFSAPVHEFIPIVDLGSSKLGHIVTETGDMVPTFVDNTDLLVWNPRRNEPFDHFRLRVKGVIEKMDHQMTVFNKLFDEISGYIHR